MMTKKSLLAVILPLTFSTAYAKVQMIPVAEQVVKQAELASAQFVFKRDARDAQLSAKSLLKDLTPENWFNLSPADGAEGMRTEEAYKMIDPSQGEEIIVAVIDSGVDVNHEDLQGKIWINTEEIPNNGIDDDKNGYVDDVFGWNFIGGADGMATMVEDRNLGNGIRLIKGKTSAQIDNDTLEVTRELVRMRKVKARLNELGEVMTPAQAAHLEAVEKEVTEKSEYAKKVVATYTTRKANYKKAEAILNSIGVTEMTIEVVRDVMSEDATVMAAKKDMLALLANGLTEARLNRVLDYYGSQVEFMYNTEFNPRTIVGDDYTNQEERVYGNNDVIGPDSSHGTHVSGIIAAARDNGIGMKGVASNVKIMAIRVVPNGDERDKDVANGIRYAVDNGAKVINMSFGKAYSPFKSVVDEAVRYAESRGVLLVHAAGNDSKDNDVKPSFPSRTDKAGGADFNNWLEIGASSYAKGLSLPAEFSNFGKKTVDLFAPGVDVYSTMPDNGYDSLSGTSMASPAAAGAVALALSVDPSMDADAVKALMIDTSRRYPKLQVNLPGTETPVLFSTLSTYGSIVDVLSAVKALK